jgi:hypothetical protein
MDVILAPGGRSDVLVGAEMLRRSMHLSWCRGTLDTSEFRSAKILSQIGTRSFGHSSWWVRPSHATHRSTTQQRGCMTPLLSQKSTLPLVARRPGRERLDERTIE